MPPVATVGCVGEPSVRTWQAGGGVALLAQTLAVVKLATGKLKVWADAVWAPKIMPISNPRANKPPRTAGFIIILSIISCFQKLHRDRLARPAYSGTLDPGNKNQLQSIDMEWARNRYRP